MAAHPPGAGEARRLAAGMVVILLVHSPLGIAAAAGVTVLLYLTAGMVGALPAQVWSLRVVVGGLVTLQALTSGWAAAVVVTGRVVVAVLLAGLITLTTRVLDLLDVLEQVLQPCGGCGWTPNGSRWSSPSPSGPCRSSPGWPRRSATPSGPRPARQRRAYAVPLVVRTLRHADALGEALVARGLDDPAPSAR